MSGAAAPGDLQTTVGATTTDHEANEDSCDAAEKRSGAADGNYSESTNKGHETTNVITDFMKNSDIAKKRNVMGSEVGTDTETMKYLDGRENGGSRESGDNRENGDTKENGEDNGDREMIKRLQIRKLSDVKRQLMTGWMSIIAAELDSCVTFWRNHSLDDKYGGFYTCLTRSGDVYDDSKFGWMQGRQTWMFAKLYNELERFHTPEILEIAVQGAHFMYKFMKSPTYNRCYYSLTREGRPTKVQRQIFTECFYVMAMAELYRATRKIRYKTEVDKVMKRILEVSREGESVLGRPKLNGCEDVSKLSVPMIIIKVLITMEDAGLDLSANSEEMHEYGEWCLKKIIQHAQRDNSVVLENVLSDGKEFAGCDGRLMNPGHVIECGWFCLVYGKRHNMPEDRLNLFLDTYIWRMFDTGWDKENGGLFYFLDVDGYCPMKLEWNFKLWWPICEAMVAMLMAYKHTRHEKYLDKFKLTLDFAMKHLKDEEHGEWFGYLNVHNEVQMDYKGSEWKGFYHVPNALLLCEQLLKQIISVDF